jgi:DNA-binding NarL/FixJ family response regulator
VTKAVEDWKKLITELITELIDGLENALSVADPAPHKAKLAALRKRLDGTPTARQRKRGESTDYEQTLELLHSLKPDILLTDLRMRVGANAQPVDFARVCEKVGCVVVAMTFAEIDRAIEAFAAEMNALRIIDKTQLFHTLIPTLREIGPRTR